MPGFIIHIGREPFELAPETRKRLVVERIDKDNFFVERRVVNKFMNDRVFLDLDDFTVIVEGVVLNNHELMCKYASDSWVECVIKMYESEGEAFFNAFRGSFSGALYDKKADKWIVYTGHTGEKQVFYAQVPGGFLFGSEMRFMVGALKQNGLPVTLDKTGCYLSLTHGFCIEDRTLVSEIHKLIAGHYLRLTSNGLENIQYHRFSNKPDSRITQEEAIEGIDKFFRQAIKRQFEKDREYGYRHIACLSGGLDSRMTVWVAHEMGYTDQTNIDFSQSGYLDFTISQQIAIDLHHDYFFHPLDGGDFIPRYKFSPEITYGSGFLMGHGYSLEKIIDYEPFGIMHTGQIGDSVIGSFFKKNEYNLDVCLGQGAYSHVLLDRLDNYHFIEKYENEEIFCLYTRAFTGANQGLLTFQENTESCSPFTDVDFLEYCYSIPLNLRFNHKVYIDWVLQKYPKAGDYVWEKTGKKLERIENHASRYMIVCGVKVPHFLDPSFSGYVKGYILRRLGLRKKVSRTTMKYNSPSNMNPIDYWYHTNPVVKDFLYRFWDDNEAIIPYESLRADMGLLFKEEATYDKLQCLNVLAAIRQILQ